MTQHLNVLVTGVNGDLAQSIIKALRLAKEKFRIFGTAIDSKGVGSVFVDEFALVPPASSKDYLEVINKLCLSKDIQAVIPASLLEIETLGRAYSSHTLDGGAKLVAQNSNYIQAYGDKLNCMQSLDGHIELASFVDPLDEIRLNEFVQQNKFPFVLKEAVSSGSKAVLIIHSLHELKQKIQEFKKPILQGFIEDTYGEFSVGIFRQGRGKVKAISFKRDLGPVGCTWYAQVLQDPEVLDYAIQIAELTDVVGSVNVQVRKNNTGVKLLEINPRFSSLASARAKANFNDVLWSLKMALGMNLDLNFQENLYKRISFQRFISEFVDEGEGLKEVKEWKPNLEKHT